MTVKVTLSGLDASNEGTSFGVYMVDLTAANFDARATALAAVQAAVRGVSKIAFDGASYPAMFTPRETTVPADPYAQRELKWRVSYSDNVNARIGEFEIGGPELTGIIVAGTDFMNLASTEGAALVTALEANCRSRDGNAINITEVKLVGRTV